MIILAHPHTLAMIGGMWMTTSSCLSSGLRRLRIAERATADRPALLLEGGCGCRALRYRADERGNVVQATFKVHREAARPG
jgi:hypothetical protein